MLHVFYFRHLSHFFCSFPPYTLCILDSFHFFTLLTSIWHFTHILKLHLMHLAFIFKSAVPRIMLSSWSIFHLNKTMHLCVFLFFLRWHYTMQKKKNRRNNVSWKSVNHYSSPIRNKPHFSFKVWNYSFSTLLEMWY
jgi:hypothetical protein